MKRMKAILIPGTLAIWLSVAMRTQGADAQPPATAAKPAAQAQAQRKPTQNPLPVPDFSNVSYGTDPQNVLDLWLAKSDKPTPLVVFIHGGGFMAGDKKAVPATLLEQLLKSDISMASLNYRLTGNGVLLPTPQFDCARAIQFLRSKSKERNLDPARVGVCGGSAGAGISLWMAYHKDLADPSSADPVARQSTRVTCVAVSGAQSSYDPHVMAEWFGAAIKTNKWVFTGYGVQTVEELDNPKFQSVYDEVSAIKHLTKDAPPTFMVYQQPNIAPQPDDAAPKNVHHPLFGYKLKEAMENQGCRNPCTIINLTEGECATMKPAEKAIYWQQQMADFFRKNVN